MLMRCAAVGGVSCEVLTQMAVGKPSADRLFLLTHGYLFLGCTEGMAEGEKSLGREDPGMLIHFKTVLKSFSPLASHLFLVQQIILCDKSYH